MSDLTNNYEQPDSTGADPGQIDLGNINPDDLLPESLPKVPTSFSDTANTDVTSAHFKLAKENLASPSQTNHHPELSRDPEDELQRALEELNEKSARANRFKQEQVKLENEILVLEQEIAQLLNVAANLYRATLERKLTRAESDQLVERAQSN